MKEQGRQPFNCAKISGRLLEKNSLNFGVGYNSGTGYNFPTRVRGGYNTGTGYMNDERASVSILVITEVNPKS